ncbi:MAG: redoxin domain-containing protein [Marinoscillum sp.]
MKQFFVIALTALQTLTVVVTAQNVGDSAPDFTLDLVDGGQFKLSDHDGKVVFIFFFGHACPHCISNGPNTESGIYQVYKDNSEFVAVGVDTWDGNASGVENYRASTNITYPLALKGSGVQSDYKTTYDRIVVIDKDGIIRYKSSANATSNVVSTASNVISKYLDLDPGEGGGDVNVLSSASNSIKSLHVYPNPTTNYLILESESLRVLDSQVQLFNLSGKSVRQLIQPRNKDGRVKIPVADLPVGANFLVITYTDGSSESKTFLIDK